MAFAALPSKLVWTETGPQLELFNLDTDPTESQRLLGEEGEKEGLARRLQAWQIVLRESRYESVEASPTDNFKKQLEALGYLGDN